MFRRPKELVFAIVVALLLHVIVITLIARYSHPLVPPSKPEHRFHVNFVSPPSPNLKNKQVVKTPPPEQTEKPQKADYLSEHDQRVKRQTISHTASPQPHEISGPSRSQLQQRRETGLFKPARVPSLLPSWKELQMPQSAGSSGFNDYVENVEEDAQTRLNTFEWKHATYFNRIKEGVSRAWNPMQQIHRYDPQGTLIGHHDRITVLLATIDKNGRLIDIRVKDDSGVYYLDDEAVRAFKVAEPFPNPPAVLFAGKDRFTFPFGFFVSFEKGLSMDFNWSR